MNDAVITGYSVVSPLGITGEEFSERMFRGESGVKSLSGIVHDPDFPVSCAGLLPSGIFPPLELNNYSGEARALLQSLLLPFRSNGLGTIDGLVYGTNNGLAKFNDIQKYHSGAAPDPDNLRQDLGIHFLLQTLTDQGHSPLPPIDVIGMANGCVTGLAAVIYAAQRIRAGRNKRMLVVTDEIRVRPEDLLKYNALGALSRDKGPPEKVSRPFSLHRSGFVKGEGAGLIILEDRQSAEKRGTRIFASVEGYRLTSDAWRLTDGREDLKGMCSAMEQALAMAGIGPEKIDYINAHGTSTPNNDFLETMGIKRVFGKSAAGVPISSLKSQIGHLNFSCGMVELIACLAMLEKQRVAPTINYERDPQCDLNYVPERSEDRPLTYILKNSFGFGGANATIILKR